MEYKVGDKVINTVLLNFDNVREIPIGTLGVVRHIDTSPYTVNLAYGIEVAFEGFESDTYPCNPSELGKIKEG